MKTAKQLEVIDDDATKSNNTPLDTSNYYEKMFEAEKAKNGSLTQMIRVKNTNISEMSRSLESLNYELKLLKENNADFKVTNLELKESNRDLKAKLSRLQNTIDNLQRALREQATKVLDDMFFGIKK